MRGFWVVCLLAGIFIEQAIWDETMNQSPDESTVAAFEVQENSLATVMKDAIDTAQHLADQIRDKKAVGEHSVKMAEVLGVDEGVLNESYRHLDELRRWEAQAAGLARILEAVEKERTA